MSRMRWREHQTDEARSFFRLATMKLSLASCLVLGAAAFQAPSQSARAPTELAATKKQVLSLIHI